jgi:beta-xylosidase
MAELRSTRQRVKGYVKRLLGLEPPPKAEQPRNKHLWSIGMYSGSSPLDLTPDDRFPNPVLTRDHVTDVSAGFVADPFLLRKGELWHMFFEVLNRKTWLGEIAVATSRDLASWEYGQVVLTEPFHISYPFVFEWKGEHYMIPETHKTRTIRLYRAEEFPTRWALVHTMMSGQRFADTTLFRHDDRWWLFTETSAQMKHDTLRLYYADDLMGAWTEHPASPIVEGDPHGARPGGSVVRDGNRIIRFAQDCAPRYGVAVHAFVISKLTPTEYVEEPAAGNPILSGSGSGWNESGMHHVNAHQVESGQWIAAVDGWYPATLAYVKGDA